MGWRSASSATVNALESVKVLAGEGNSVEFFCSAQEPLPQQGDHKNDNANHHSDGPCSISLFCHIVRCGELQTSFDARAGIEEIAQGVADEVEREYGQHDCHRRKDYQVRCVEQVGAAIVEHGAPAGGWWRYA